jgi:exosortase
MISVIDSEVRPAVGRIFIPWAALLLAGVWTWTIWSCAEHWLGNPNYSYGWAVPVLAFGFGVRRYLITAAPPAETSHHQFQFSHAVALSAALALGALAGLLEYARQAMWHPQIVLESICLIAVAITIGIFRLCGGRELAGAEIFPTLFFLTAVPWPARFEQPITSKLMQWVASATAEVLHWLGVEAQTSGGAIALRTGLVGITEACSGVRSLQAGIMFGLAMGEWFLLRPARRIILVLIAIILALLTNLIRTLALTLQAERHGVQSLDRVHDLIGNVVITSLILAIWIVGRLLRSPNGTASLSNGLFLSRGRAFLRTLFVSGAPVFRAVAFTFLAGILCARILYARLEAQDRTQTAPFFVTRIEDAKANRLSVVPREVWQELRPTSGEYIRHENPGLPGGGADCFHFFWKPSAWNRFALVHRPDICMPGVGWASDGPAEAVDATIDGHSVRCYLFRFQRENAHALELWGAWRNGETVALDYRPEQVLGAAPLPSSMHFQGKRRSATEIVACSVIAEGSKPAPELAVALLQSVFHYKPND